MPDWSEPPSYYRKQLAADIARNVLTPEYREAYRAHAADIILTAIARYKPSNERFAAVTQDQRARYLEALIDQFTGPLMMFCNGWFAEEGMLLAEWLAREEASVPAPPGEAGAW